jgi:hypothetical protein
MLVLTLRHNGRSLGVRGKNPLRSWAMISMTAAMAQPDHPATPAERIADLQELLQQAPDLAPLLEALIERLRQKA